MLSWKVAQWGQVKEEKTFTVTLACSLPIFKTSVACSEVAT